jgi:hypothetical protein
MAPEVIEHNPYREKADVFSFGITMWELLTARVPYEQMTPLQAAVGVVQKGLRPTIPPSCPEGLAAVMRDCWQKDPRERPSFEILKVRAVRAAPLSPFFYQPADGSSCKSFGGTADAHSPLMRPGSCLRNCYSMGSNTRVGSVAFAGL